LRAVSNHEDDENRGRATKKMRLTHACWRSCAASFPLNDLFVVASFSTWLRSTLRLAQAKPPSCNVKLKWDDLNGTSNVFRFGRCQPPYQT
jgi:hypothetical protein